MREEQPVKLRCPRCGRFLVEAKGYAKAVCRDCACELTYRSKEERRREGGQVRVLSAS